MNDLAAFLVAIPFAVGLIALEVVGGLTIGWWVIRPPLEWAGLALDWMRGCDHGDEPNA